MFKKILVVLMLLGAVAVDAKPTNQVLVLTTATRVDLANFYARRGITIQNHGPNTIWCAVGSSAGLAVGFGFSVLAGDTVSWPVTQNVPVYCLAATANQVAGAATDVIEF